MSKILVFQHVPYEILGTLDPLLRRSGFRIKFVNFGRNPEAKPSLEGYRGLVVLGGPMNVDQTDQYKHVITEINLIQEAIDQGLPVLGICLGAQLIAKALGAKVSRNNEVEIGWYEVSPTENGLKDPLLSNFQKAEKIFQWHGDSFAIPDGAVHLAQSACCLNQAFRYRNNVYAFQFHLEVDQHMIERWLLVPQNKKEIEKTNGLIDPEGIRKETLIYIDRLKQLSDLVFSEFIKRFGVTERRHPLPSR
ncbi:gamma-glutamyl-gamma-aminobutyrate hydrolase family protein [Desulfobacterota bacterium AH_259_B03_O07]|nr:gamma-glutamyl-gamma-aminobutyrate hydrolase family protein [Desulfobacterota bacterium AH_259_B03_O07]